MTSLLQSWLVKYKCSCSAWFPLCQMHYCRKCLKLGCPVCVIEEVDIVFCPNCLENVTNIDTQHRRFRCRTCYECPMCGEYRREKIYFCYPLTGRLEFKISTRMEPSSNSKIT